jgi:hypothetical protein
VADRDVGRIADRGEVDRLVPGQQEPDVIVDPAADLVREPQPERVQRAIERVAIRGGQRWKEVDARRERVRRTVQAPSCVGRALADRPGPPLPASSYVTPRSNPAFRCRFGSRPGFPVPLAGLGLQAVGADAGR